MGKRRNYQVRFKAILYLLFVYVLLQLFWWGTLLSRLNREVLNLKHENIVLTNHKQQLVEDDYKQIQLKIRQRDFMFLGEGIVFTIILCFGIYRLLKVIKAENNLNQQQQNFMLSVTHELKSPLASAKLQIETLLKLRTDANTHQKLLNNALSDIDRLNLLTDNILTAAQLENNNFKLHLEKFNVVEFADTILQKFRVKFPLRVINLHSNQLENYCLDRICFNSILYNLLENAIKYSDSESPIEVVLEISNETLVLVVADNGIGISDNDKSLVFKKFYRIGNEQTRKFKGTGLGLFILKELVDMHGGKCSIEDNKPKGTKFIVTL